MFLDTGGEFRRCRPGQVGMAAFLLLAALSGCAPLPPRIEPPAGAAAPAVQPGRFHLGGRVSVKYDGQGFSGGLRWQQSGDTDDLLLLSPLGQGVAHVVRDATGVSLTTADQQNYRAPDAESLTEQVLGWRLPLSGLRYWVLGAPAPGPGVPQRDQSRRLSHLDQDGWRIDYLGYQLVDGVELPGRIEMQRGDLEIRLLIDEWLLTPAAPDGERPDGGPPAEETGKALL
jgi:outer membrane lipoprotein LolB